MAKTSKAQLKAIDKYDREHTRRYMLKVNKKTEPEIYARMEAQENRQGYIKDLIRRDIKRGE